MPVQIGDKAHHFGDPTGLLSDCHRRIEMFLGSLERIATTIGATLPEENRNSLEAALRYFKEAALKHTADEEESLFPRLRSMEKPELQNALERLASLEDDHRWAGQVHEQVNELGRRALRVGSLPQDEAEQFRSTVQQLRTMYSRHIQFEDEVLFPAAARCLSAVDKTEIAHEMAARRKTS